MITLATYTEFLFFTHVPPHAKVSVKHMTGIPTLEKNQTNEIVS